MAPHFGLPATQTISTAATSYRSSCSRTALPESSSNSFGLPLFQRQESSWVSLQMPFTSVRSPTLSQAPSSLRSIKPPPTCKPNSENTETATTTHAPIIPIAKRSSARSQNSKVAPPLTPFRPVWPVSTPCFASCVPVTTSFSQKRSTAASIASRHSFSFTSASNSASLTPPNPKLSSPLFAPTRRCCTSRR